MFSPSPSRRKTSRQRRQNQQLIQQFHTQRAAERLSRNLQAENEDFAGRYWGSPSNATTRDREERWVHDERGRRLEVYVPPRTPPLPEEWEEYRGEDEIDGQEEEEEEEVRGRRSPSPPPPYQRVEIPPRDARGDGRDDGGCSSRQHVDCERSVREERVRDREGSGGRDREERVRGRRRFFFGRLGRRETSGQRTRRVMDKRFLKAMGY